MKRLKTMRVILLIVLSCLNQARCDSEEHSYKVGDYVPFFVNTIGPLNNPRETYSYFDLPFCQQDYVKNRKRTLGEALNGDNRVNAPYKLEFRVDRDYEVLCRKNLTKEQVSSFRMAIERGYIFQMLYDDLPIWASIGKINTGMMDHKYYNEYLLHAQTSFEILFNEDRVIAIHVKKYPESLVDVTVDKEIYVEFLYSVYWKQVDKPFEKRMEMYSPRRNLKFMRFTVVLSCITLILLIGILVKVWIRDFRKDLAEDLNNEESGSNQEARGWRGRRDNVFEYPSHKSLFAAAIGSGAQLITLTMVVLILGIFDLFPPFNGRRLWIALVIIYATTSIVAGYISAYVYCKFKGVNWFRNLILTESLFCGPLFLTFCLLNSIATSYHSTMALSFGNFIQLVHIWIIVAFPLLVLGGICGRGPKVGSQATAKLAAPLQVDKVAREIPQHNTWYKRTIPQMVVAGLLPFNSLDSLLPIMINCVWGIGSFTMYHILFIVVFLSLLQVSVVGAVFTAKQLAREDLKWWWRSFVHGGSVGLYVYGRCVHYYYAKSEWSGSLQLSFYFGYMACVYYGLFLMFGTLSFAASFLFVRFVYRSTKSD